MSLKANFLFSCWVDTVTQLPFNVTEKLPSFFFVVFFFLKSVEYINIFRPHIIGLLSSKTQKR